MSSINRPLGALALTFGMAASAWAQAPYDYPPIDPQAMPAQYVQQQYAPPPQPYAAQPPHGYTIADDQGVDPSAMPTAFEAPAAMTLEERVKQLEKQAAAPPKPAPTTYPNVKINGVFQVDSGWFHQDAASLANYGRIQDGSDFRRARLAASGNVTPQFSYFMQMDFAFFGRPTFTDVWVAMNDVPVFGNIKVGQWKQPFSLEVVSSFRYTTFMERSVMFQPLTPFHHIGVGFYNWSDDEYTTWAASAIRTGQDQYGGSLATDGGYGAVGRITHLLHWDEYSNGRGYTHIGAGYYLNAPPNDRARFRTIPEFFVGENGATPGATGTSGQAVPGPLNGTPFFVDTGAFDVDTVNTFGGELLWVQGPLSVQSEVAIALVDRPGQPNLTLPGGYFQVGYFLTGEHRPYDRKAGAIDRVKPFEDFFWVSTCQGHGDYGMGAWEVAARVSYLDLNDANIHGGQLTDFTFGVNWFLNPYTKLVANYIHAFTDQPNGIKSDTDIYAVRAQLDF